MSRSELRQAHQDQSWQRDLSTYDEQQQRAIRGLQYHPSGHSLDETWNRIQGRVATQGSSTSTLRPMRRVLSIAAGFAVLVLGVYFLYLNQPVSPQVLSENAFQYLRMENITRLTEETEAVAAPLTLREQAIAAYEDGKKEEAERLIRVHLEDHPKDTEMKFYYGIILLGKGQADSAIPYLKSIEQDQSLQKYERQHQWYLALAYLRLGNVERATPLLESLAGATKPKVYASEARALLKRL